MGSALLVCENIHKSYTLGRTVLHVLRGIDLNIQQGQFVAIIGASGSGKSTLLHVLSGLDVPQKGQVYFRGEPLFEPEGLRQIPCGRDEGVVSSQGRWRLDQAAAIVAGMSEHGGPERPSQPDAGTSFTRTKRDHSTRRRERRPIAPDGLAGHRMMEHRRNELLNRAFGFVFQFYHLLPEFDVLENIALPQMVGRSSAEWLASRVAGARRALSLLDRVGLADRRHHRPSELSGGERQRVAIARALVNEPQVLFADEPTGNLDGKTGRDIFGLLKTLNKAGQTLVMVTHDRDLAAEADVVVRLVDGKVQ